MFDDFIIGIDSQIGKSLFKALSVIGRRVSGTSRRNKNNSYFLDLASDDFEILDNIQAKNVFMVAAMTSFKECRENQELAKKINLYSPIKIASNFSKKGSRILFLSSSAVLQNTGELSHYGILKAQAELEISRLSRNTKIIRLSKVIGPSYPLFRGWLESLSANKSIEAFEDLNFSPISLSMTVNAIIKISDDSLSNNLFQLSAKKDISYYEAAIYFAKLFSKDVNLVIKKNAISSGIPSNEIPQKTSMSNNLPVFNDIFEPPDPYNVLDEIYLNYLTKHKT